MIEALDLSVRGPRVLIRAADQRETVTDSGIIAVAHDEPSVIGTVLAVGERVVDVHPGDVVLFTPESGQVMEFDGQKLLVLTEDEILAVWDEGRTPI